MIKKLLKINGYELKPHENKFAYDGCHKIYLLRSEKEEKDAKDCCYQILPIEKLQETYKNSCPLRFISTWDLTDYPVKQVEKAIFTYNKK
jgi:hypothetical protein